MNSILENFSKFVINHLSLTIFIFITIITAEFAWYFLLENEVINRGIAESRKEQLKLRSVMFNNLAVAMFSIGFVTPLVGALYHVINASALSDVITLGIGWLAAGIVFHFFGIAVLRGLR